MTSSLSKIFIDTSHWHSSQPISAVPPSPIPYSNAACAALGIPFTKVVAPVTQPQPKRSWKWAFFLVAISLFAVSSLALGEQKNETNLVFNPSLESLLPVTNAHMEITMNDSMEPIETTIGAPKPTENSLALSVKKVNISDASPLFCAAYGALGGAACSCLIWARIRRRVMAESKLYGRATKSTAGQNETVTEIDLLQLSDNASSPTKLLESLSCMGTKALSDAYSTPEDLLLALQKNLKSIEVNALPNSQAALLSVAGANPENQDYGIGFEFTSKKFGKLKAFIIADGCGGHHGARAASFTAASRATMAVLTNLTATSLEELAREAIETSSQKVQAIGQQHWGVDEFRTTLIVMISDGRSYSLAHIGDGGAWVRRAQGEWISMLTPHKGEAQNILTASLGPKQIGQIASTSLTAQAGDFVTLGTDGIFDVIANTEEFFSWMREEFDVQHNFSKTIADFLNAATQQPELFDDNMTLACWNNPIINTIQKKLAAAYATPSTTEAKGALYV